ncbi:MAG: hypothetical protein KY453_03120 [Gemmatimonadetes bacterium]|nr:hypothetical protein [Gemmatimonadota bacterium]
MRHRRTSGSSAEAVGRRRSRALVGVALAATLVQSGCMYSFRGGSFPDHIRTIAVETFENDTNRFEISGELFDVMLRQVPRSLGIRVAGAEVADAVVRGTITRYDVTAPNYRPTAGGDRAEVLQRQVALTARVEIVDLVNNVVLWEEPAVRAEGIFLESEGSEEEGRLEAIDNLVQKIVDGAQSNW